MKLTGKSIMFKWSEESQQVFGTLREVFVMAPVLAYFDWTKEMVVETDASNWVSADVLLQQGDNGFLHPMDFYSRKHSPAEANYEIDDKKLMAKV